MSNKFQLINKFLVCALFLVIFGTGCKTTQNDFGKKKSFPAGLQEAEWIRNGDPIKFENELWYPVDGVESFLDSEMRFAGEYQGIPFFTDKVDIRPYERLYTKFDRNKFRFFKKRSEK